MKTQHARLYELRQYTQNSVSLTVCLQALNTAEGDVEKAKALLRERGYLPKTEPRFFNFAVPEDAPPEWVYILSKVHLYLQLGPDMYRKQNAFAMPSAAWDTATLQAIQSCFQQFSDGKGYTKDNPVEDVSIEGFYAAMTTLHFEIMHQTASYTDERRHFIDEMLFEHVMYKTTIRLFNKVLVPRRDML